MTGLEKLVKHIEDAAASSAQAMISEAEGKAGKILKEAEAQGEAQSAEILKQSALQAQVVVEHAQSAALLEQRRAILDAKLQAINNVLTQAREELIGLPDDQYAQAIVRMIGKYALNREGQIVFSASDLKRLPPHFEETVRTALSDKPGASLTLSKETRELDGGFVLVYGDVEVNCSFEALFSAEKEALQDKVSALLFG